MNEVSSSVLIVADEWNPNSMTPLRSSNLSR